MFNRKHREVRYVTCPYCGYKLVDAMQAIGEALPW